MERKKLYKEPYRLSEPYGMHIEITGFSGGIRYNLTQQGKHKIGIIIRDVSNTMSSVLGPELVKLALTKKPIETCDLSLNIEDGFLVSATMIRALRYRTNASGFARRCNRISQQQYEEGSVRKFLELHQPAVNNGAILSIATARLLNSADLEPVSENDLKQKKWIVSMYFPVNIPSEKDYKINPHGGMLATISDNNLVVNQNGGEVLFIGLNDSVWTPTKPNHYNYISEIQAERIRDLALLMFGFDIKYGADRAGLKLAEQISTIAK